VGRNLPLIDNPARPLNPAASNRASGPHRDAFRPPARRFFQALSPVARKLRPILYDPGFHV